MSAREASEYKIGTMRKDLFGWCTPELVLSALVSAIELNGGSFNVEAGMRRDVLFDLCRRSNVEKDCE